MPEKNVEHESDGDTNCNWCAQNNLQRIYRETGRVWNRTNGDYLDYNIIKFGQNTEKSPGDFRRFAVTQTQVENHQLTLALKSLNVVK